MTIESKPLQSETNYEDYVDIFTLFARIWAIRWLVATSAIVCLLAGLVYLRTATPIYTATMIVIPTSNDGSSKSRFGGLEALSLIGVSAGSSNENFDRFTGLLTSHTLAVRIIEGHDILPTIFRNQWDIENKSWHPPGKLKTKLMSAIKLATGMPGWHEPDAKSLAEYLGRRLKIENDDITGFLTISYSHANSEFAVELLSILHRETDALLREIDSVATIDGIAYILTKLEEVTIRDHRMVLVDTLRTQEQKMMQLQGTGAYVAEFLDRPVSSAYPTSPNVISTLMLAFIIGAALGTGLGFHNKFFDVVDLPTFRTAVKTFFSRRQDTD